MGTRSTIQFRKEGRAFTVYQCYDSQPEYTLPELQKFLKWNGLRCGDIEFTAANFIFYSKIVAMESHIKEGGMLDNKTIKTLSDYFEASMDKFGADHVTCAITDNDHQDEQYFYIVDLDVKTIKVDNIEVKFGEEFIPKEDKPQAMLYA